MAFLPSFHHRLTAQQGVLIALLLVATVLNGVLWGQVRHVQARWTNVPPVPPAQTAAFAGLGDREFAFRIYGNMIENFGIVGGLATPLKDYNFDRLADWFYLQYALDPQSDHGPFLAAYVFGASQDPSKIGPLILYLEKATEGGQGQKWRWLAQAAYLARFKRHDLDTALRLARKLAAFDNPDLPAWARQMPVFVMNEQGDKEAALGLMVSMLHTDADKLPPAEVNAMVAYICEQILTPTEAKTNPLCQLPEKK